MVQGFGGEEEGLGPPSWFWGAEWPRAVCSEEEGHPPVVSMVSSRGGRPGSLGGGLAGGWLGLGSAAGHTQGSLDSELEGAQGWPAASGRRVGGLRTQQPHLELPSGPWAPPGPAGQGHQVAVAE